MADATTKLVNPVFYVKMGCIVVAVVLLTVRKRLVFQQPTLNLGHVPLRVKIVAAASLLCWFGALTAGRLMAYLGPVSGLPGLENSIGQ
jgi:hypothetical protein